ncbi:origin recognition complex subunit Orc5, putative [Talaromyces stipitatus ATCC 10500]|uniref:Origin recognition complex subunit Orc5, putative n=1 Tax=Talaromyces stipitatus (strain ATCC 10500 / CBS 375.48 / QM 6759 / NRRL 1006) TaxID=441959 RepID=B8MIP6_TALSN|nr:origin recognition complex subunit Orc5, putative [Talaromyces stipitatus ATCC 10500]EED15138.1 origin recognition complex subunit Orc5, putative [Talaromyces stipitatus ATCC 10500]
MVSQPHQLSQSLSQQWPCRETQIRQLAALLHPRIPSPPTIVLYGISATCKSTLVSEVLDSLPTRHAIIRCVECITSRHLLQKILIETLSAFGMAEEWEKFGKGRCEHVSTLLILLGDIISAAKSRKNVDDLNGDKFVLVLDGIDRQREASQMLLAALARLGEMIPSLIVVLIMNTTPRPLFLQSSGVAHINFPPYTRKEAITIVTAAGLPRLDGLSDEDNDKLSTTSMLGIYTQFVVTVYDSLVGPTAGTIPSFRSICERLWPRFLQPMTSGEDPGVGWDFTRLLLRNRAMFKMQGESMLVHHIVSVPEETSKEQQQHKTKKRKLNSISTSTTPKLPSLPYFPTLVLTSAYVASHTPQRLDTIFFSKFSSSSLSARNKRSHHRRRLKLLSQTQADDENGHNSTPKKGKRVKTKITKSMLNSAFATTSATTSAITGDNAASGGAGGGGATQLTGSSTLLTARPFTLERLIAIYHAIDPNPPANALHTAPIADAVYNELATLRRLRLVVPASGGSTQTVGGGATAVMTADVGEKWCINVSGDWVGELAKGIGVEVGEWLAGGLD